MLESQEMQVFAKKQGQNQTSGTERKMGRPFSDPVSRFGLLTTEIHHVPVNLRRQLRMAGKLRAPHSRMKIAKFRAKSLLIRIHCDAKTVLHHRDYLVARTCCNVELPLN